MASSRAVVSTPLVEVVGVRKTYHGLRPLRVDSLTVGAGELVALGGFDAAAAEVLSNLLTGATLPDRGEIRIAGRDTRDFDSADTWLRWLDCIGLVSDRTVLLEQLTVEQNLAMAFTLDIDPPSQTTRASIQELATEVGLETATLSCEVRRVAPEVAARVRLARAVALNPRVLLLEHATSSLATTDRRRYLRTIQKMTHARGCASVAIGSDLQAQRLADRSCVLEPTTAALRPVSAWRRWL